MEDLDEVIKRFEEVCYGDAWDTRISEQEKTLFHLMLMRRGVSSAHYNAIEVASRVIAVYADGGDSVEIAVTVKRSVRDQSKVALAITYDVPREIGSNEEAKDGRKATYHDPHPRSTLSRH